MTAKEYISRLAMDPSVRVRKTLFYLLRNGELTGNYRDNIEAILSGDANFEIRKAMKTLKA